MLNMIYPTSPAVGSSRLSLDARFRLFQQSAKNLSFYGHRNELLVDFFSSFAGLSNSILIEPAILEEEKGL